MTVSVIFICDSAALQEGALGVRFPLTAFAHDATGFVVRHGGKVHGYLNQCAHLAIELDWNHGVFFDSTGEFLMCSTHGALYVPETGRCAGGPCRGKGLRALRVFEEKGQILWQSDEDIRPVLA